MQLSRAEKVVYLCANDKIPKGDLVLTDDETLPFADLLGDEEQGAVDVVGDGVGSTASGDAASGDFGSMYDDEPQNVLLSMVY